MPLLRPAGLLILSPFLLAVAAATSQSCCALTAEELGAIKRTHMDCPKRFNFLPIATVTKCQTCPSGTCRVNGECFCPGNFVQSFEEKDSGGAYSDCISSFGEAWPESVGKEDVMWRSCEDDVKVTDFGTKSCCALTEEELLAAVSTSDLCPQRYNFLNPTSDILEKCGTCPPGTCRVEKECHCPYNFLRAYELRESSRAWSECATAFGENWPDSIGKEDIDLRLCDKQDPVTADTSKLSSSSAGSSGGTDSATGSGTDSSSGKDDDDETGAGGDTEKKTDGDGENAAERESNGGINWEKVRICCD